MDTGTCASATDPACPGATSSAAQFVTLLSAVRAEPWFDTWYAALPVAGNPDRFVGGTLRSRMGGTAAANNVHAKTGSLTGASALSGYVTDADGRLLAFSIVLNNYLTSSVKGLEDQIAIALASYTEGDGDRPADRAGRARVAARTGGPGVLLGEARALLTGPAAPVLRHRGGTSAGRRRGRRVRRARRSRPPAVRAG
ncbi:D-alanyl-D-alanine carboxypeptidase [Micromonospora sp. BRA006-A]|nr:D-alanyl-D-alanine carboxypeptidase [Micromonospora sp. BRA006-A]